MPIDGQPLTIEPRYPHAERLMEICGEKNRKEEDRKAMDGITIRNTFWSSRWRTNIMVWNEPDGKLMWGPVSMPHQTDMLLLTLGASDAWGLEQEHNALTTLGTLIRHRQMKQYILTGSFIETSKRSGVKYVFRRLRPTLALRAEGESMRILCALCMHPIGYYEGTWAGAMCPSDEVIAALMMMRGDEPMFWRRANQHPPNRPQAGI
jgi:hypothetical protein